MAARPRPARAARRSMLALSDSALDEQLRTRDKHVQLEVELRGKRVQLAEEHAVQMRAMQAIWAQGAPGAAKMHRSGRSLRRLHETAQA